MNQNKPQNNRPDMRGSPLVEEDPRERAARRAKEVREHLGGLDEGTDEFVCPAAPAGWTYEWKRHSVMGQHDPAHQIHLARQGWEPVPAKRHPEMMPIANSNGTIERKGMILMERPTELVEESRMIEQRKALGQVRTKEAQLAGTPDGTLPRDAHPNTKPQIKKSFEAMPIPE